MASIYSWGFFINHFLRLFAIVCLVLVGSMTQAARDDENREYMDVRAAQSALQAIKRDTAKADVGLPVLKQAVDRLNDLQERAENCVEKSKQQLTLIDEYLKTITQEASDAAFFNRKNAFYKQHISDCRTLEFQLAELASAYNNRIVKLSAHVILERSTPIWRLYENIGAASLQTINWSLVWQRSGLTSWQMADWAILAIAVILALVFGLTIRSRTGAWIDSHRQDTTITVATAFVATLRTLITPVSILLAITFCVYFIVTANESLFHLLHVLLLLVAVIFLARMMFYPGDHVHSALRLSRSLGQRFYRRFRVIAGLLFIGYTVTMLFKSQTLSEETIDLSRTLWVTALSVSMVWFLALVVKAPLLAQWNHSLPVIIRTFLLMLLLVMLSTEWLGYHSLAIFLLSGTMYTILLVGVTIGMFWLAEGLFQLLQNTKYTPARRIRQWLGIKLHKQLNDIIPIKIAAYAAIVAAFVYAVMSVWNVSANLMDAYLDALFEGFAVAELKIIPLQIAFALMLFSLIMMSGRFLATLYARRHDYQQEQDVQVAMASIIVYISFGLAVLIAMVVAGVNITGLAIVAGALSVGIGLGLQNIVNNFASGLILLIEKPIKPGDRVIVGNTEGFVKRVRIRSTQITTLAKEDIIVPNADLISNQVTNYMFRDRQWRVVCQVGVAYGSDIDLVRETLFEVAEQNADVIKEAPNKPRVLFRQFGDSSLVFELWCIIGDVNKKYDVISDLNFAIDQAFRQHKIVIAFPQRDVHIYPVER